jgi:ketosteroid isomerase-like protein
VAKRLASHPRLHLRARAGGRTDGDTAWIAAGWRAEATGTDGEPFTRPGRATFNLAPRAGRWLCVHSHVSLQPTQSESARGRLGA